MGKGSYRRKPKNAGKNNKSYEQFSRFNNIKKLTVEGKLSRALLELKNIFWIIQMNAMACFFMLIF